MPRGRARIYTAEELRLKRNAYMREWKRKNKDKVNASNNRWKDKNRELVREWGREYFNRTKKQYYARNYISMIKARCIKRGIPFDMRQEDLVVPEVCPVLGIPLVVGKGSFSDNSPSVDRLVPSLGYVTGNVRIISYRANAIKRDATLEELEAIVAYLRRELGR